MTGRSARAIYTHVVPDRQVPKLAPVFDDEHRRIGCVRTWRGRAGFEAVAKDDRSLGFYTDPVRATAVVEGHHAFEREPWRQLSLIGFERGNHCDEHWYREQFAIFLIVNASDDYLEIYGRVFQCGGLWVAAVNECHPDVRGPFPTFAAACEFLLDCAEAKQIYFDDSDITRGVRR